jgi:hypothetical protein
VAPGVDVNLQWQSCLKGLNWVTVSQVVASNGDPLGQQMKQKELLSVCL